MDPKATQYNCNKGWSLSLSCDSVFRTWLVESGSSLVNHFQMIENKIPTSPQKFWRPFSNDQQEHS